MRAGPSRARRSDGELGHRVDVHVRHPLRRAEDAFVGELNADQRLLRTLHRQLRQALDRGRRARRAALERDLQREHRLRRDRQPERRLQPRPCGGCRRSSARATRPSSTSAPRSTTSTRWSKRRSRRPRTSPRSCAELRPVLSKAGAALHGTCASPSRRPGHGQRRRRAARRPARRSSSAPRRRSRTPKRRSPTSSRTSTSPAPTRRTSSTASPSSARSPATTTATATTRAIAFADLNLFNYDAGGELEPITAEPAVRTPSASAEPVKRRCPGGATQPAPDGSNPFVEPPFAGSGVTPSECDPADVPPGP